MILKNREIEDLNKLVLDKDYVVKDCQDQLGHLLEKDYNDVRVSVYLQKQHQTYFAKPESKYFSCFLSLLLSI